MANYLYKNNNERYGSFGEMKVRQPMSSVGNLLPCNGPRVSGPCKHSTVQDGQCDKENAFYFKSQGAAICEKVLVPNTHDEKEDIYKECIDNEKENSFEEYTEMQSFEEEDEKSASLPDVDVDRSIPLTEINNSSLPEYLTQIHRHKGNYASPLNLEDFLNDSQDSTELSQMSRDNLYDYEEYSKDIYDYLRKVERKHLPDPNYMQVQPYINFKMRAILIDWLVDVALEYSINNETLYLSVSLIDRFLCMRKVPKTKLQLLGTTAMFIAGKYEEIYCPRIKDFVDVTDDSCSKQQIHRMEQIMLTELDFKINVPTINFFLQYICRATDLPETVLFLAQYLCELTLLEAEKFLLFSPSQIAAAAICLANHSVGYQAWDAKLENTTGYKLKDIRDVMDCLYVEYRNSPHNPLQAIRRKYKKTAYNGVFSAST